MKDFIDLKPCPFCKGEAVVSRLGHGFLFKMGDVCEPLRHFDNAKKTFEVVGDVHTWGKRGR